VLHYATESSRCVQIIDIIALAGFDVHAVDHGGTTVLHYAAFVGHCDAVEKSWEVWRIWKLLMVRGKRR
jgi:ankyrin repeat protein